MEPRKKVGEDSLSDRDKNMIPGTFRNPRNGKLSFTTCPRCKSKSPTTNICRLCGWKEGQPLNF